MKVTGITAAKAAQIEGASIVNGVINPTGQLILTKGNGEQVIAGQAAERPQWLNWTPFWTNNYNVDAVAAVFARCVKIHTTVHWQLKLQGTPQTASLPAQYIGFSLPYPPMAIPADVAFLGIKLGDGFHYDSADSSIRQAMAYGEASGSGDMVSVAVWNGTYMSGVFFSSMSDGDILSLSGTYEIHPDYA